MSIVDRNIHEFERQESVVHPFRRISERNNNLKCSPSKRVLLRRKLPSEILDDLPESSVDPLPGELEDGGRGVADGTRLSFVLGRDASDFSSGRIITLVGSPVKTLGNRSKSVDYIRKRIQCKLHIYLFIYLIKEIFIIIINLISWKL